MVIYEEIKSNQGLYLFWWTKINYWNAWKDQHKQQTKLKNEEELVHSSIFSLVWNIAISDHFYHY
jgi:hypothetical protein